MSQRHRRDDGRHTEEDVTSTKSRSSEERIAHAWVQMQSTWWAHEALHVACKKNPRKAWRLLVRLSDLVTTRELVQIFGAGPLEDFIRSHAPQYIDRIEEQASTHRRFRDALRIAWLPSATDAISLRLFALGCRRIDVDPAFWQTVSQTQRKRIKEVKARIKRAKRR